MAAKSLDRRHHRWQKKNCGPFYPFMTLKIFHTDQMWPSTFAIMMSSRRHLWCHLKKSHSFPMRSACCVPSFNFFPWCGFRDIEIQSFSVFLIWLLHHVTNDVTTIIETFYMSIRTNGDIFVSIRQAVADKNTKVLCGQTNRQTDKQEEDVMQSTIRAKSIKQIWLQK